MKVALEIRGREKQWAVTADMSREQIAAMWEDGVDVGIIMNSGPGWVIDLGLWRPWCFLQDLWNLKNPFNGDNY